MTLNFDEIGMLKEVARRNEIINRMKCCPLCDVGFDEHKSVFAHEIRAHVKIVGDTEMAWSPPNKKHYLKAWNDLVRGQKKRAKAMGRRMDNCVCLWEEKQEPNAVSGVAKVPSRLWHCPTHGNTFALKPPSANVGEELTN